MTAYKQHLEILGLIPWQQRKPAQNPPLQQEGAPAEQGNGVFLEERGAPDDSWASLQTAVAACIQCSLHTSRTQTVFGVGNREADIMFVGEAPGFYEDQKGEPFVGRAGQLLTAMIQTMGLERKDVFIANILKCRPPENRDPLAEEIATCTPYLNKQIALVKPKLLVAVGRIAAHYLLGTKSSLESLRNTVHQYGEEKTPLIVTYHPAYLLRNPVDKKKAFADLQFIKKHA